MTTAARSQVLYITYDGLLEPLGQSQVLAYLEKLAPEWPVHILSFEKSRDRADEARLAAMQISFTDAIVMAIAAKVTRASGSRCSHAPDDPRRPTHQASTK